MDRHLSPSETARRIGVSIKALRLYEHRGLLTPLRSAAGWRTYGPAQIARLHQILALKRLGLPLARIGELLVGPASSGETVGHPPDSLDKVLAFQEQVLARQSDRLSRALALIKDARHKLAAGRALSIDDLATLAQETVMHDKLSPDEYQSLMRDIGARHFNAEEIAGLRQRKYDQSEISADWDVLLRQATKLMQEDADPASPSVQAVAVKWRGLIERFTGGDPQMLAKLKAVWRDIDKRPRMIATNPVTPELRAFMGRAVEHLPK